MNDEVGLRITPQPSDEDRAAIEAAVLATLRREAALAQPSAWRLAGRVAQRAGITDLGRFMPAARVWPASATVGWGGRAFPGLIGRGDAR